jgi:hypothetical protein
VEVQVAGDLTMRNSSAYPFFLGLAAGIGLTLMVLVLPGALMAWFVSPEPGPAQAHAAPAAESRPVRGAVPTLAAPTPALNSPSALPTRAAAPPASSPTMERADTQPTAEPSPGVRLRIAHTDGQGVALRSAPSDAARQPAGFLEGEDVTLLERAGNWVRVRGDSGLEGWVPAAYLDPVD